MRLPEIDLAPHRPWRFEAWTADGAYAAKSALDESIGMRPILDGQAVTAVCGFWRETAYAGIKLLNSVQIDSGTQYILSFLYRVDGNQRYQVHG